MNISNIKKNFFHLFIKGDSGSGWKQRESNLFHQFVKMYVKEIDALNLLRFNEVFI